MQAANQVNNVCIGGKETIEVGRDSRECILNDGNKDCCFCT